MDANGIDASVVMPAAGSDPVSTHDAIAAVCRRLPDRIFGMVSMTFADRPRRVRARGGALRRRARLQGACCTRRRAVSPRSR